MSPEMLEIDKKLRQAAQAGDFDKVRDLAYEYLKSIPYDPSRSNYRYASNLSPGVNFTQGRNPQKREAELATLGWVRCYETMFMHDDYLESYRDWVYNL